MIDLNPTLGRALIENYLAEQAQLQTPVARFAETQDHAAPAVPGSRYSSMIPLTAPGPGEQYAFEVNLDACCGCKACVTACHSLNGLDEGESWRDVGLIITSGENVLPFQQTITTACHHCADPACLNGCPVLAYEKDPATGIVRHLDDQCIGCSYCEMKCPYEVPKFNKRLGIVRKCDMCHSRLSHGEAPACVQACPTHAIRIINVPAAAKVDTSEFLAAAPDPAYTKPTTRYVTTREIPKSAVAADANDLSPQHPHWPLVVMLTLMPFAIGANVVAALNLPEIPDHKFQIASVIAGGLGIAASILHLGQPTRAWRIFLGLRRSWLSREAMLFGLWLPVAAASLMFPKLTTAAAAIGVVSLLCSVMVYVDTQRRFWRFTQTFPRFFGTGALLVLALVAPTAAVAVLAGKMLFEMRQMIGNNVSARLQSGPLRLALGLRLGLAFAGFVLLVVAPVPAAFVVLFAAELTERYLFFTAVDAPKMPGMSGDTIASHRIHEHEQPVAASCPIPKATA